MASAESGLHDPCTCFAGDALPSLCLDALRVFETPDVVMGSRVFRARQAFSMESQRKIVHRSPSQALMVLMS